MEHSLSLQKMPTLTEMYLQRGDRRWLKRCRNMLRYEVARWLHRADTRTFLTFLQQHPIWKTLFQHNLHNFHAILFKFADNRLSASQRRQLVETTLNQMYALLGEQQCQRLLQHKQILLSQLGPELSLCLQLYEIDPFESFFSLSLRNQQNQRLYDIAFVFRQPQHLLVSCIQGPGGQHAQQIVKQLTKQLHGLRPMYFMLHALQQLCQQWQCQLDGIPSRYQVKKRWYGHQRIFFDYDEFWQENGGKLQGPYWHLPLHFSQKPFNEIPSKKRAMYRKRYQMLETLVQDLQRILQK